MEKKLPFSKEKVLEIIKNHPTPFHIYDKQSIEQNAQSFLQAFSWVQGFKNYFAVKACPNPFIMKILQKKGMGMDCSSLAELMLAEKAGIQGEDIMFTSNDTPSEEYIYARKLGAIINLDDISHIDYLEKHAGLPDILCFRYNPGPERTGNAIIGNPVEAKYGFTKSQLFEGYQILKQKGIKRFGLHTMVASNELNPSYFVETARMIFSLVSEISSKLGIRFEFVNLGGGIGIPYRPDQNPLDFSYLSKEIQNLYHEMVEKKGLHPLKIAFECGRMPIGPYGYLVSKVLHLKHIYKNYVGLDACMANLMRPGMYGAYHHITVLGKENSKAQCQYDITGSLCENNDKFAVDRLLPIVEQGDILVIHDTGAHGHAMGFNYNGKLRSCELMLQEDGSVLEIRRAETPEDYFKTLDFEKFKNFKV
ncbi:MAG: diaminopimelate decarboxylase [Candidatus Brocadiae bacterium]|nr:diaminopimelate decarboxylase [Candidatus Brocadiia bacterium]